MLVNEFWNRPEFGGGVGGRLLFWLTLYRRCRRPRGMCRRHALKLQPLNPALASNSFAIKPLWVRRIGVVGSVRHRHPCSACGGPSAIILQSPAAYRRRARLTETKSTVATCWPMLNCRSISLKVTPPHQLAVAQPDFTLYIYEHL